jgi:hypothetical protein
MTNKLLLRRSAGRKFFFQFILSLMLVVGISTNSKCQVFYSANDSKEFKHLKQFGIKYIKTGTSQDKDIEEGLKKYWKTTKYRVIDPKNEKYHLNDSDIVIALARVQDESYHTSASGVRTGGVYNEDVICLVSGKVFANEQISRNNIIGYTTIDVGTDSASLSFYLPILISGLNDYVNKIMTKDVNGIYPFLNGKVADAINENSYKIKDKTLLLIGNTMFKVVLSDLDKAGLKYEIVSRDDFAGSISKYGAGYCLLYFSDASFTDIAIFDMADKSLLFTWFYHTGNHLTKKFDKKDISRILQK